MHPDTDPSISCEVLEYFLRRLSSPTSRQHAILVSKSDCPLMKLDKVNDLLIFICFITTLSTFFFLCNS